MAGAKTTRAYFFCPSFIGFKNRPNKEAYKICLEKRSTRTTHNTELV